MPRRSNLQILIEALTKQPNNQASPRALAVHLGWDPEKVKGVVEKARYAGVGLFVGKGGVVQFRGKENHSNGLYTDVGRVIQHHWGPKKLGLRNIDTIHTAQAGTRGQGVWTHPDLVIAADPRRRASQSEPRRLHAIEVEVKSGFDLKSVYQAHAQGRGADYTWVFGNLEPEVSTRDWDRIMWTAEALGVGLVTFGTPGSYTTWRTWVSAEHKTPTSDERTDFVRLAVGPKLQAMYEL